MFKRLFAGLALSVAVAAPATAATINYFENGADADIPGLAGFATTGAMMDGMSVTACFSLAGCQTVLWADRAAPNSGGTVGANGWDLEMTGDTFSDNWTFDITDDSLGQLLTILLDGRTGLTVFDRTFDGAAGTDGSALGTDFFTSLNGDTDIDVTYLNPIGINGAAPVGDIFQQVFIDFLDTGPRFGDFTFVQDTDNDERILVPEPSTLALLGLAALALVRIPRRR
jgi:hypothetical protein